MMTKEKATKILAKAFSEIFYGIESELNTKKVDIEERILLFRDVGTIRSLADELNTVDKALKDIGNREDTVMTIISSTDEWYNHDLLCELNRAFIWLPEEDEAE